MYARRQLQVLVRQRSWGLFVDHTNWEGGIVLPGSIDSEFLSVDPYKVHINGGFGGLGSLRVWYRKGRVEAQIQEARGDHREHGSRVAVSHGLLLGEDDRALPNGSRLSCGALKKESSFNILRAPTASSAC